MIEVIERLEDDNLLLARDSESDLLIINLKIDLSIYFDRKRELEEFLPRNRNKCLKGN